MGHMRIVTREDIRHVDTMVPDTYHVPLGYLMENAGRAVADYIVRDYQGARADEVPTNAFRGDRMLFLCGTGNNGGDGLVAARHIAESLRVNLDVYILGNPEEGSDLFKEQLAYVAHIPAIKVVHCSPEDVEVNELPWPTYLYVVDAIMGVGFNGRLSYEMICFLARIHNYVKAHKVKVVAVDLPTGTDANTGESFGLLPADVTITLTAPKVGMYMSPAFEGCGEIQVAPIGFPWEMVLKHRAPICENTVVETFWPSEWGDLYIPKFIDLDFLKRSRIAHKGTSGHVHIVGGSDGMYGAPLLAGTGALRTGAGKTSLYSDERTAHILSVKAPFEFMVSDVKKLTMEDQYSALVLGPGLGRTEASLKLMHDALHEAQGLPMVIDADGLYQMGLDENLREEIRSANRFEVHTVITPHYGEFLHLLNHMTEEETDTFTRHLYDESIVMGDVDELSQLVGHKERFEFSDREEVLASGLDSAFTIEMHTLQKHAFLLARAYSKLMHVVVVLKGMPTYIVFPSGEAYLNLKGNPNMATGGMGDVLSGVIGTLLAEGLDTYSAARLGVYLHSRAGDLAKEAIGRGLTPSDVAEYIPHVYKELGIE